MKVEPETKNARITKADFDTERTLTFYLYLEYGDSGCQSAGGYRLDSVGMRGGEVPTHGANFIHALMDTLEVMKWSDLAGKIIRVKATHSAVLAVGHPLKDKWLHFQDWWDERLKGTP